MNIQTNYQIGVENQQFYVQTILVPDFKITKTRFTTMFAIAKDPFETSEKCLKDIKDQQEKWKNLAFEYFNEDPETVGSKVQQLKEQVLGSNLKLVRYDDLYMLKFLRAGGGNVEKGNS